METMEQIEHMEPIDTAETKSEPTSNANGDMQAEPIELEAETAACASALQEQMDNVQEEPVQKTEKAHKRARHRHKSNKRTHVVALASEHSDSEVDEEVRKIQFWRRIDEFMRHCTGGDLYVFDFDKTLTRVAMSSYDVDAPHEELIRKFKPYVVEHFPALVRRLRSRGVACIILSFCSSRIVGSILERLGLSRDVDTFVVGPDNYENTRGQLLHEEANRHPNHPHRNMKYRFLHTVIERYSLRNERIFFYDDRGKHIRAVGALGVNVFHVPELDERFRVEHDPVFQLLSNFGFV